MAGPAGSITSTIWDLKNYVKALTDGEFISDSLNNLRLTSAETGLPKPESKFGYGIGIFEYDGFFGHNGGFPGFTSLMIHSPERNCTIIVWYNCQLHESPTDLINIIPDLIYKNL